MLAMVTRREVASPSSGISIAFEDWRAEDARADFTVPVLVLRVEAVEVRVERDVVLPGIVWDEIRYVSAPTTSYIVRLSLRVEG